MSRLYVAMTNTRVNQYEGDNHDTPRQHGCGHSPSQPDPKIIEKFRKQKASSFNGLGDPPTAETWVRSLERILSFMECTDAEKVVCATHQFEMEADYWWESTTRMMPELAELTWEKFKEKFREKYIPRPTDTSRKQNFGTYNRAPRLYPSMTEHSLN